MKKSDNHSLKQTFCCIALSYTTHFKLQEQLPLAKSMANASHPNTSSDDFQDPDVPAFIGRFMPKKVLGRGGQGVVYLAEDPNLERQVAIKTLLTNDADPSRLIGEAKNVASLDHPGIVPVYEIESTGDSVYLVYQFVPGDTLSVWLKNNSSRKPKDSVNLIEQILDAIAYAHNKGIIHRDLSPVNVIVDDNSRAKILDFGVSTIIGAKDTDTAVVGTMKYLPPECLSNGPIGPHSDVYTIAVMFHEMLTGRSLFDAENSMAVAYKIINEKIPAPSLINNDIDDGLDKIVMTGLAREPANRYQNAGEMLKALEDYLESGETTDDENVYSSAVEFMLRRVARKPDFPAVSRYITEISQKTGNRGSSDASELADVILKDYALTSKLLRLVNSAVFGHYGGSISTVSRAVVILGFDQVRAAALSIAVFEHLQNGQQADTLKDAACSSFLSAMLARDLVDEKSGVDPEQAFIGAMFHRLGRHLAIYYFPEEYEEVKALIASKGVSETAAVKEILGTSYAEFGLAIGEQWNLPPAMLRCMKPLPEGKIPPSTDTDGKMVETAGLANELAEICGNSSENELDGKLKALKERYADCVKLDTKVLREKVAQAIDATREYANVLSVDLESADFFGQVMKHFGGNDTDESAAERHTETSTRGSANIKDEDMVSPPPEARKSFLVDALTELTTAMVNKASPNEILAMVVKSIYQGLDMSHVLLLIRDPKRHVMQARSGHGKDLEAVLPEFGFKISKQQDIFNQALRKGKEFIVLDVDHEQYKNLVPSWCRDLVKPYSVLLFPIMANGNCIGMVYADQTDGYATISADEFKLLVTLVQQSSLAIQQRA